MTAAAARKITRKLSLRSQHPWTRSQPPLELHPDLPPIVCLPSVDI
jgi:hypothetical protein